MYKIVFFGTPKIAEDTLKKLIESEKYKPCLVITQKDKPVGRKKVLTSPPVKVLAEKYGIEVFQPESIKEKEVVEKIKNINPDLIVVFAYGHIIPKEIIDIPKFGVLNIHTSILPKYRGPSPIQYAILNGDKKTGVTLIQIDEQLDHGPILAQKEVEISEKETSETLHDKLAEAGANLLLEILPLYFAGKIKAKEQEHKKATFTKLLRREDGEIFPKKETAKEIERKFRAFHPWPGIFLNLKLKDKNLKLKIINCSIAECKDKKDVLYLDKENKLILKTKEGCLWLKEVQPEGKQKMSGGAFWQGYKDRIIL